MSVQYLTESFEVVLRPVARHGQSVEGYGRKISTDRMVKINSRFYRVYATCFSNVASYWIMKKGQKLFFLYDSSLEVKKEKI